MRASEVPLQRPSSTRFALCKFRPARPAERTECFRALPFGRIPFFSPISCDSHDPDTILCGLKKRLLRDLPVSKPHFYEDILPFALQVCEHYLKPLVRPMTYEEWRGNLRFPEWRLAQYDLAHASLRGGVPSKKQCEHVKSFIKREYYDKWTFARWINSRSDAFKTFSGPYFASMEKTVYENIPYFVKHLTMEQRIDKILELDSGGVHFYATDFTAYESHFTSKALQIECVLYHYLFPGDKNIDLICDTLMGKNRIRMRNGLKLDMVGGRMSGDMCTSLGNGFTNLVLFLYAMRNQGYAFDDVRGVVEGDDGLFAVPLSAKLTNDMYSDMGFTIKIEEHSNVNTASFCRLVFGPDRQLLRDPFRFISGFGWSHSFLNSGLLVQKQLLRAKALSALYETPNCPIVFALARQALRETEGVVPRFIEDGYHTFPSDEIDIPASSPTPMTRALFERLYGVPVSMQIKIEQLIYEKKLLDVGVIMQACAPDTQSAERLWHRTWYENRYIVEVH